MQNVIDKHQGGQSIRSIASDCKISVYKAKKILIEAGLHEIKSNVPKLGNKIRCIKCKEPRDAEMFNGLHCSSYVCRFCGSNSKLQRAAIKQLGNKFFEELLKKQNGGCGICGKQVSWRTGDRKKYRLAVDHDHKTGAIRGLLCGGCNIALGLFKDSPQLLENAIRYLNGNTV